MTQYDWGYVNGDWSGAADWRGGPTHLPNDPTALVYIGTPGITISPGESIEAGTATHRPPRCSSTISASGSTRPRTPAKPGA
jgi:hypothetical protein